MYPKVPLPGRRPCWPVVSLPASVLVFVVAIMLPGSAVAEVLSLDEALDTALENYAQIRAREAHADAARHDVSHASQAWLPDLTLSAQQSYGTINAMHGPLYSPGGPLNASTSIPLGEQSWNASFGALYSVMAHWNVLTFGKIEGRIDHAESTLELRQREVELERFEHQLRVASAYLRLSTAQRVTHVQRENVSRHRVMLETIVGHANSGLLPEVDASIARAELANAESLRLKAHEAELDASRELAVLLGVPYREFLLEPTFHQAVPERITPSEVQAGEHPLLAVRSGEVRRGEIGEQVARADGLPSLYVFGGVQGRGSGFESNYGQDQSALSRAYLDGVGIERENYFVGLGASWNVTSFLRSRSATAARKAQTRGLSAQQQLAAEQLAAQEAFAERKFDLAQANQSQTMQQHDAALDGYRQRSGLYENGLATIVELTQAIYALARAEVDVEVARSEVWQAVLLKAAASGDMNALLEQVRGAKNQ